MLLIERTWIVENRVIPRDKSHVYIPLLKRFHTIYLSRLPFVNFLISLALTR